MTSKIVCHLSRQATQEAVATPTGYIFDRKAIEKYIEEKGTCPETGKPLKKEDLVPLHITKQTGPKRMIADADEAEIDNSLVPEPLVMFVAVISSIAAGTVLALGVAFKLLEYILLIFVPLLGLCWCLTGVFAPATVAGALDLDVDYAGLKQVCTLCALASWGAIQAGLSGCSHTKAKFLTLMSILLYPTAETLGLPLESSVVPFAVGVGNFMGPRVLRYLKRNHSKGALRSLEARKGP
eukprot:CAMPEP_0118962118 /NCGR_PEP_ID=MMETSP1173-20130426/563_1 /TAXON_ID=1034831 /ORGANISM="Rhizochromulina marina cf, Strain CCMP1243" /LENGTH=238 /DNA_ID=CAMNT_0006910337 /DNA_START=27 /DNA_END=743 /DNA_ORIENTATION=+